MRTIRPLFLAILAFGAASGFAQTLPADAQQTCTANIAPWFASGSVTLNGSVNPADSLVLNTSNNCNFYLWSEQMFLWMTSPAPSIYGGIGRVFQSPVFFGVVASGDSYYFVPQFAIPPFFPPAGVSADAVKAPSSKLPPLTGAKVMKQLAAALRPAKRGPNGLPTVIDRKGRTYEVVDTQRSAKGKPIVLSRSGAPTEVSKVTVDENRRVTFYDAAGTVIPQPRPVIGPKLKGAQVVQRFFTSPRTAVFVDSSGSALDVSPEQAGSIGAVLLAQSNAVVYYTIAVNDVYAWFLTGMANGAINTNNQFPTTQADLDQIVNYAAKYGVTFPDPNALAIEAKMSWVDASTLPNPSNYITMPAVVPVYNTSSSQSWPQSGTKPVTLALLGMHVVGSSNGHPELLWATFEHFGNTPNAAYQYVNTAGNTATVPQNTSGTWLFSSSGSSGPFNVAHANYLSAPSISAQPNQTISRSDTLRQNPFGVAPAGVPNQNDATPAIANTEVLALNNSVLGQLVNGDVRRNYFFLGTTWTFGGAPPTTPFPVGGNEIGTSYLANSTMETYQQWMGTSNPGNNCLDCHQSSSSSITNTDVSHIFGSLIPLFTNSSNASKTAKAPKPKKGS
ncbi:MAG TPA: hypothetical protein VLV78_18715 [Thermoanaerobaculia bacterium]|nr:hypothetical protein [Thermoanaerobaculia bacterium]